MDLSVKAAVILRMSTTSSDVYDLHIWVSRWRDGFQPGGVSLFPAHKDQNPSSLIFKAWPDHDKRFLSSFQRPAMYS